MQTCSLASTQEEGSLRYSLVLPDILPAGDRSADSCDLAVAGSSVVGSLADGFAEDIHPNLGSLPDSLSNKYSLALFVTVSPFSSIRVTWQGL